LEEAFTAFNKFFESEIRLTTNKCLSIVALETWIRKSPKSDPISPNMDLQMSWELFQETMQNEGVRCKEFFDYLQNPYLPKFLDLRNPIIEMIQWDLCYREFSDPRKMGKKYPESPKLIAPPAKEVIEAPKENSTSSNLLFEGFATFAQEEDLSHERKENEMKEDIKEDLMRPMRFDNTFKEQLKE